MMDPCGSVRGIARLARLVTILALVAGLMACGGGGGGTDASPETLGEVAPDVDQEITPEAGPEVTPEMVPEGPLEAVTEVAVEIWAPGALFSRPPSPTGELIPSSWVSPDSSNADVYAYDSFEFATDAVITEVRWRGGYTQGAVYGPVTDFSLTFYDSAANNTQPNAIPPNLEDTFLTEYWVGGNAGETPVETVGSTAMYEYRYVLPSPFAAQAGVRYWLRVEGAQAVYPDWGIARGVGGDYKYFRFHYGLLMFQWGPGDTAFDLY